jgi:hypothetical protein
MASSRLWAQMLDRFKGGQSLAILNTLLGIASLMPALIAIYAVPLSPLTLVSIFISGILFGGVFLSAVASTTAFVKHNMPPSDWVGGITAFTSNGAFVHKYPILPIVIKYEDESLNYNHDNHESMLHSCLKLFLVRDYNINIKVCDMVEYEEGETIEAYNSRVYKIMNDTYQGM